MKHIETALLGYRDGSYLKVNCPECKKIHLHGWTADLKNGFVTHRGAHCSPKKEHDGYNIVCFESKKDLKNSLATSS
jgi:predicted RNA binding protein YcfA (HicA-like mRNA interferase family)